MTSSVPNRIDEALARVLAAGRLPDLASLPARAQGRMRARMREALAEAYCRGSDDCLAVVRGDERSKCLASQRRDPDERD